MKLPGLKLGSANLRDRARTAHEAAEDNAIESSPEPDKSEIKLAITAAAKALIELEAAVVRMLTKGLK